MRPVPAPAKPSTLFTLAAERLEPRTLLAAEPELFRDLSAVTEDSVPTHTVVLNDVAYFFATDNTVPSDLNDIDRDLWRSDGTAAGTWKVKELPDGDFAGFFVPLEARLLTRSGNLLYFVTSERGAGTARGTIWRSDGTEAGTFPLTQPQPISPPVDVNGTMYWVVSLAGGPWELWKSNGTPAGTTRVKTFTPWGGGSGGGNGGTSPPYSLTSFDGYLFFSAGTPETGTELWRSDGTEAGTVLFKDLIPGPTASRPQQMSVVGDRMFFAAFENLWVTDGTPEGTVQVKDFEAPFRPTHIVDLNGVAYFVHFFERSRSTLWRSDGTPAGTVPVIESMHVYDLVSRGGRLYFSGGWTSDGTAAGTYQIASGAVDFTTVTGGPAPGVYFRAADTDRYVDLWRTDGTVAGTVRVIDSGPGAFGNVFGHFAATSDGRLFFSGDDEPVGHELFVTDGTPGGTRATRDINTLPTSSSPHNFGSLNGIVYFFADSTGDGYPELWRTDGTAGGTRVVKESRLMTSAPFVELNGVLYFRNWRTDGTPQGTYQWTTSRMTSGVGHFGPVPSGNRLYFSAPVSDDTTTAAGFDDELWSSDGTPAGTRVVKDINPGDLDDSEPMHLTDVNGTLFFTADHPAYGRELWKSDGTEAGTVLVKDITPGVNRDGPVDLINVNGVLYFVAYDGTTSSLWRSDGTAAGTSPVAPLASVPQSSFSVALVNAAGTIYALATAGSAGPSVIVRSDGTPPGSVRVLEVNDRSLSGQSPVGTLGSSLLFVRSADGWTEPWISDGTPGGTRMLKDVRPGTYGSSPADFYEAGGVAYFSADDGQTGRELWRTDGTTAGTVRVADLNPSSGPFGLPGSSDPASFFRARDGTVYFAATRNDVGRELWRIPAEAGDASVVGRHVFYNNSAFDGGSAEANAADDGAVATDKRALLPGAGRAGFNNLTSYSRGINGIIVDLARGTNAASLTADDFTFRTGTGGDPAGWTRTVTPTSVRVRPGAGAGGSDRVLITFADGAVRNTWLQATVKANDRTGLSAPDVFYFGNLVGEAGPIGAFSTSAAVNAIDFFRTRSGIAPSAPVTSPLDFNRDGRVSPLDLAIVRSSQFRSLPLIAPPASAPPPRIGAGAGDEDEDGLL